MEKSNNEMIKELADTLEYLCFSDTTYDEDDELIPNYKGIAEELISVQGYRKLHKDSVVLSREEYDKFYESVEATILSNIADGGTSCHWCNEQNQKISYKQASKETAEKILKDLTSVVHDNRQYGNDFVVVFMSDIQELAKQFGVEIKE